MTFMVTLIALLLERFFNWSHLRRWNWFLRYQEGVLKRLSLRTTFLGLAATIIPLLIIIILLQISLQNVLFGFVEFLFQLWILLYCLGPQNLWADSFFCVNTVQASHPIENEIRKVPPEEAAEEALLSQELINNIFIQANRRVFAVIFWFVLLGPLGAFFYRTITLSASKQSSDSLTHAYFMQNILEWLPARLMTLFFALGGHFVNVVTYWRKKTAWRLGSNDQFLVECGMAALGDEHDIPDELKLTHAINLLDRSLVITLVIIAIGVLLF